MLWYYARNGQRMGPVEETEIQRLAETGHLAGTDLVWKPGLPEWRQAAQVPELASFFRPAAPPPPPPPPPAAYSPYTPPAAPLIQPPAYPAPMFGTVTAVEYASFGARFGALVIDQIIVVVLGLILGFVGGIVMAVSGSTPTGGELIWNVLGILVTWIYYAGLESSSQMATLGKRVLGLKVTDLQGQRIDFARASGRHFGKILSALFLGIGFLMMIWDEKNQTLHDKMSGCLVVRG
jgi:uncharacterized RDD family membrane protein YckC